MLLSSLSLSFSYFLFLSVDSYYSSSRAFEGSPSYSPIRLRFATPLGPRAALPSFLQRSSSLIIWVQTTLLSLLPSPLLLVGGRGEGGGFLDSEASEEFL